MTRDINRVWLALAVILAAALLAFLLWTAVSADGPTLSPPEMPTATPPAPDAYPGPDPYPAPYPAPGVYLPIVAEESYP